MLSCLSSAKSPERLFAQGHTALGASVLTLRQVDLASLLCASVSSVEGGVRGPPKQSTHLKSHGEKLTVGSFLPSFEILDVLL